MTYLVSPKMLFKLCLELVSPSLHLGVLGTFLVGVKDEMVGVRELEKV